MTPDPAKIIVPRRHGEVLIEPGYSSLLGSLRDPAHGMALDLKPAGFTLNVFQLRFMARRELWNAWSEHLNATGTRTGSLPPAEARWIFTGHQVEFYHPGVWAKVIVADELARRSTADGTPAVAFDLLVDHDVVDHLGFDVPAQLSDDNWKRESVEFAPPSGLPVESLHAPTLEQFSRWDAALAEHPVAQTDALAHFLTALHPGENTPNTYAAWMSRARTQFELAMGVHVHHVPTSLLCQTHTWYHFVRYWIAQADMLSRLYNKQLAAYRQRQGIKNPQHPMPNLARSDDPHGGTRLELPFWIFHPGEPRQRLVLRRLNDLLFLQTEAGEIDITHGLAPVTEQQIVIRPRALTLTMFVRLFLADLFIHGIGGALYDQITDGMLQELFGTIPPYACVSAAWLLPLGKSYEPDDLAALKWRRHHVKHNPQLAIDPFTALKTDVAELIRDRRVTIEQLAASLASSHRDANARQHRRALFDQLHTINEQLHTKAPRILANLDHQLEDAARAMEQNKVLNWREWFFGLHTTDSLRQFIGLIRKQS